MEKKSLHDGAVGSAFTTSSHSTDDDESMHSATHVPGIQCFKDTLRIELPMVASGPCTSPASPAEHTGTSSPQTAIYRPSDTAFHREMEHCTPLSITEHHARQSAIALLHAGASHHSPSASGSRSASRGLPVVIPTAGHYEPVEATRKKTPMGLLANIMRRNRSNLSASGGVSQREMSIALDRASGAEPDGVHSGSVAVNHSSGSYESPPAAAAAASVPLSPERQQQRNDSPSTPPALSPAAPPLTRVGKGSEDCSDSAENGTEMDVVLRDASRIRGLRLTWLLYLLIIMVIVLFVLILVQLIFETNRTLTRSATEAVRAEAASLLNSVDMQQYALEKLFNVMRDMDVNSIDPVSTAHEVVREAICSSIYRAPIAFVLYNATGVRQWTTVCKQYMAGGPPATFPEEVLPGSDTVRLLDYGDVALAHRTYDDEGGVATYMVMMDKDTLGRILMNNDMAQYSSATLQSIMSAFYLRPWSGAGLAMLLHTLTQETRDFTMTPYSSTAASLTITFRSLCFEGSPFIWHTVAQPMNVSESADWSIGTADWPTTTTNPIPHPRLEYDRAWGLLSRASLCGVQCTSAVGSKCDLENPTNVWFLVDYPLDHFDSTQETVTIVGALSIVAVVIFSFIMFLVYLSITVPVNYLRYQLVRAVGSSETATPWQRKIVRWTYRLWLGDLTSIARSIYILTLCFRLNKKYVPEHVLRNHAKELYQRRRKFNFLDDEDIKDDAAQTGDSDSENEVEPPLPQLVAVGGVLPPPDAHFLWRFSAAHDMDQAAQHPSADAGVECAAAEAHVAGEPTVAELSQGYASVAPLPATAHEAVLSTGRPAPSRRGAGATFDGAVSVGAYGELDELGGVQDVFTTAGTTLPRVNDIMTIRREYESTVLCIRIPSVELAYLINYAGAVHQHRRLMRVLLHRIRRHNGALFHRSGDCLGAVWNAFEGCPNHAECAVVCAQEIANAFAPYRGDGLHIGMVLHQGTLVCGTVEYSKTAFVTAFGDGPREALAVAELAANINTLNVLVTEPVKQALSGIYDCNIVDVIQLPNSAHPLLLFELSGSRSPEAMHYGSQAQLLPPDRARFSVEYARAFAQFRNHEFTAALQSIQQLRQQDTACSEHLLRRLERLSLFYAAQPAALPRPYHRALPVWVNYEAIAQAGLRNDPQLAALQNESMLGHSASHSMVYRGVPSLRNDRDCIRDFKEELQANMRRLGSPRLTMQSRCSPTGDDLPTETPRSPRLSPPMRPTPLPTSASAGLLSVASGDFSDPLPAVAAAMARHTDAHHAESSSPPVLRALLPITAPPPPPPATASARPPPAGVEAAVPLRPERPEPSSIHTSVSGDGPSLSRRFSVTHGVTNLPPVALAGTPDFADMPPILLPGAVAHSDSTHSSVHADVTTYSIIQSAGVSFRETMGGARSFRLNTEALPAEIKAKNGTTYLRSTRILGRGSFGCVYLGMDAHSGRLVAIKFLPLPRDESGMGVIEAEVNILQRVNDTHVVQLLSYAFEGDSIVIVMECMLAGSLQNMISAFRTIPSATARIFMRDVLRGLSKLHSMGVIHRDMKPQNVLLSLAGNCKISDFGASAWLQELARRESLGEVCGTPVYLAPEAARGSPVKESDVWSCGVMFLQMVTGRLPYAPEQLAAGAAALVYQIGSGIAQPTIPSDLDDLDSEFVCACLQDDPSRRASAAVLLQLALFTV